MKKMQAREKKIKIFYFNGFRVKARIKKLLNAVKASILSLAFIVAISYED
jgi:sRNA-binding regulator protein Hfq